MKDESQQQVPPNIVMLAHKTLQPSPTRFTDYPDYDIWVTNHLRQNYFVHTISVDGKEWSVGEKAANGLMIKRFVYHAQSGWQAIFEENSELYSQAVKILKKSVKARELLKKD